MPNPPYDPSKLKPPLSKAQRTAIISWVEGESLQSGIFGSHGNTILSPAALQKMSDADLLKTYVLYYQTWKFQHAGIENPGQAIGDAANQLGITSSLDFLKKLGELVLNPVRMGELIVGIILVGVGVNAILKNPTGKVVSTGAKVASYVPGPSAEAAHRVAVRRAAERSFATSAASQAGKKAGMGLT